jgi:ketosteroid isomerase-like protein
MKRSVFTLLATLLGVLLLGTVCLSAAPMTTEAASLKAAADDAFRTWAEWHLNTLGATVYDKYETNIASYQVLGDIGVVRGTYTIVTRSKCDGTCCTMKGTFQTTFERQADGSWKVSDYTTIPQPS